MIPVRPLAALLRGEAHRLVAEDGTLYVVPPEEAP
ncbi:hypothetical protein Aros01_00797 [Streptosporangium roseum]|uniref:Uncharacterized protein n=1 Tax=Streptosporangium roseum (strain ATCC 12428 / DSM 43021 / JCM 3005 / KCTC 9067 / NCIMB 10171 / NRRL 2505 / NI 9100) TaxID=479432 RepID=D2ATP8_STRRD|nr:hypothetical protein Sros_3850 [Streptosporangium roseum DSM 43021]